MEGQFFAGAPQQVPQQQQQQQPFQYGYVHQQSYPYIPPPPPPPAVPPAAAVQPAVLGQHFFNPWEPPPLPAQPPADAELQKRIDKLVEFSAKNGPGFEALMKEKQKDNPAYAFLFGADGHGYYRYKLWITVNPHHLVAFNPAMNMVPPPALGLPINPPPPLPPCPPPAATFPAYYDVGPAPPPPPGPMFIQPSPQHLFDPSMKPQPLKTVPPEMVAEFRGILDNLTGTKESIRGARTWFMHRSALAPAFAEFLRDRVVGLENVEKQMHVLYLVNDILFTSSQLRLNVKELDSEAIAFRPVLSAILGAIYQSPLIKEPDREQLEKMLQHWGTREIYDEDTVMSLDREMRAQNNMSPPSSTNVVQRQEQARTTTEQKAEPSIPSAAQLSASNTSLFPAFQSQQASTSQQQQPQQSQTATGVRTEQAPYLHFPPGLIPGMVRKIQIGSGVPYSPLNPLDIPTVIPASGSSESYILDRVAKFFKDIGEPDSFSGQDKSDDEDAEDENERGGARIPPPPQMQVDTETGTLPDGSLEHRPGMTSTGRLGLGAAADPNEATQYDDVYTSYRKQRSTNYHTSMSARAAAR